MCPYFQYELLKAKIQAQNYSPQVYQQKLKQIAERLGI
jgi:hypothetical protein